MDNVAPVIGEITSGGYTNDSRPDFSGSGAEKNGKVNVYDNDKLIDTVTADDQGRWSYTPKADLSEGAHKFQFTDIVAAGAEGDKTQPFNFTVDTIAPANTSLLVSDDQGDRTGPLSEGNITDDANPTFSGVAEKGCTVIIYDNGVEIGRQVADDTDGKWSFTPTKELKDGNHSFTTEVVDLAGNSSGQGNILHVTLDTTGNYVAIWDARGDSGDHGTQYLVIQDGGWLADHEPRLLLDCKPGSTVTVYEGDVVLATKVISAEEPVGEITLSSLSDGLHTVKVVSVDLTGNKIETAPFSFHIDTTPNYINPVYGFNSDSSNKSGIYDGVAVNLTHLTVHVESKPGAIITVYESITGAEAEVMGTGVVNDDGFVDIALSADLAEGDHNFMFKSDDLTHGTTWLDNWRLTIDRTPPSAPSIYNVTDHVGNWVPYDGVIHDSQPRLWGTGEPGSFIYLLVTRASDNHTEVIDTGVVVALDGSWDYTLPTPLANGHVSIYCYAYDAAGNQSEGSFNSTYNFVVDLPESGLAAVQAASDDTGVHDASLLLSLLTQQSAQTEGAEANTLSPEDKATDNTVSEPSAVLGDIGKLVVGAGESIHCGAENDTIHVVSLDFQSVDGGAGVNTLVLDGTGLNLDLSAMQAKMTHIEKFDLGNGGNSLAVKLEDVLRMGETDLVLKDGKQQLVVEGENGSVDLSKSGVEWTESTVTSDGHNYKVYSYGAAELLVEDKTQVHLIG